MVGRLSFRRLVNFVVFIPLKFTGVSCLLCFEFRDRYTVRGLHIRHGGPTLHLLQGGYSLRDRVTEGHSWWQKSTSSLEWNPNSLPLTILLQMDVWKGYMDHTKLSLGRYATRNHESGIDILSQLSVLSENFQVIAQVSPPSNSFMGIVIKGPWPFWRTCGKTGSRRKKTDQICSTSSRPKIRFRSVQSLPFRRLK